MFRVVSCLFVDSLLTLFYSAIRYKVDHASPCEERKLDRTNSLTSSNAKSIGAKMVNSIRLALNISDKVIPCINSEKLISPSLNLSCTKGQKSSTPPPCLAV